MHHGRNNSIVRNDTSTSGRITLVACATWGSILCALDAMLHRRQFKRKSLIEGSEGAAELLKDGDNALYHFSPHIRQAYHGKRTFESTFLNQR